MFDHSFSFSSLKSVSLRKCFPKLIKKAKKKKNRNQTYTVENDPTHLLTIHYICSKLNMEK